MLGLLRQHPRDADLPLALAAVLAHVGYRDRAAALYGQAAAQFGGIEARERLVALLLDPDHLARHGPGPADTALQAAFVAVTRLDDAAKREGWRRHLCLYQEAVAETWWRVGDIDRCLALLDGLADRHDGYFRANRPDRLRRAVLTGLDRPDADPRPTDAVRADLVVVLWGRRFARLFRDQLLACLRAPGNLPALAARRAVRLTIWTDPDTAVLLEDAVEPAILANGASVEVVRFDPALLSPTRNPDLTAGQRTENKLRLVAAGHELGLRRANRAGADFFALYPDWLLSDGYFATVTDRLDAGRPVVMAVGLPAAQEPFEPILARARSANGALSLAPEPLARAAVQHLPPFERQHIVSGGPDDPAPLTCLHRPSRFLWPAGVDGLVIHSAHWYIAAASAQAVQACGPAVVQGLDLRLIDDFVRAGIAWNDVLFIEDCRELAVVGLNPAAAYADRIIGATAWPLDRIAAAMRTGPLRWTLSPLSLRQLDRSLSVLPAEPEGAATLAYVRSQSAAFMTALIARRRQMIMS